MPRDSPSDDNGDSTTPPSEAGNGKAVPKIVDIKAGRKKKPKKLQSKKKAAEPAKWTDGEDTGTPRSVTPSPPVDGVLIRDPTPPQSEPEIDLDFEPTEAELRELIQWEEESAVSKAEAHAAQTWVRDTAPAIVETESDTAVHEEVDPSFTVQEPSPSNLQPSLDEEGPHAAHAREHVVSSRTTTPPPTRQDIPRHNDQTETPRKMSQASERVRRGSFVQTKQQAHHARARNSFIEPANPPHLIQNHYFTLPGLDYAIGGQKQLPDGKPAGSDHYCCTFDSFANSGDAASAARAKDALLVGWEGGLDVYRVLKGKLETIGRLEGLRGGVVGAKVLPQEFGEGHLKALRPLLAVMIHGPVSSRNDDFTTPHGVGGSSTADKYQTTVEILSLQGQEHVATLFASSLVAMRKGVPGSLPSIPGPIGDLQVDARGRFLTIASGKSGELFVFTATSAPAGRSEIRCIGKYWTTLQSRIDVQARPATAKDGSSTRSVADPPTAPLLSMSSRWLITVPPNSSSKPALHAQIMPSAGGQQYPGASDHVAPTQPNPSVDVIGLNADGVLARYTRQAAQEILKVGRMGLEMGKAGWTEFTQPSPPNKATSQLSSQSNGGDGGFPPTNAHDDDKTRMVKEPAVVALVDLERLADAADRGQKSLPTYLAAFALEDGCNFVSLSQNGLHLLTTNRTGEASHVWDLQHVAHGCSGLSARNDVAVISCPHVRRIHGMVRNTQSVVIDAVWARDDNFIAVLTTHGTVHLNETTKRSQDEQKRRRRSTITTKARPEKADPTVSISQGLSPPSKSGFLGGLRAGWQTVSSQVSTIRSTSANVGLGIPTTFAGFREATGAGAAMGGRVVARGFSQGYSVAKTGVGDLWHADDNKIRRKELADLSTAGAIRWHRSKSGLAVAVTCGGKVFIHPVQRVTRQRGDTAWSGLKAETAIKNGMKEFTLPNITTSATAAVSGDESCIGQGLHGFWSLRANGLAKRVPSTQAYAGAGEDDRMRYETNPPYCPFYIDRRVSMLSYDDVQTGTSSQRTVRSGKNTTSTAFRIRGHSLDGCDDPWTFGDPLPPSVKLNDGTSSSQTSFYSNADPGADSDTIPGFTALDDGTADEDGPMSSSNEPAGVQSRIMVNPATSEIRINSSMRVRQNKRQKAARGGSSAKQRDSEDGFDVLEGNDDEVL